MVTSVHVTRISEKNAADFVYENDTFIHDSLPFTDCSDYYPVQSFSAARDSFLTGHQRDTQTEYNKNDRKYPIRIFTIQQEA